MTFKQNWEHDGVSNTLSSNLIEKMIKQTLPNKEVSSWQIVSGGCRNLNVKIQGMPQESAMILRGYLQDKEAAFRERQIARLLDQTIPVPQTLSIDDYDGYRFALIEFVDGISLRDLLLSPRPHDLVLIMHEIGGILAKIQTHKFPRGGFFDAHLNVDESILHKGYMDFAQQCLNQKTVIDQLSPATTAKINDFLEKSLSLLQDEGERSLVHGDFDPANILVKNIDNTWKVSGILDWEFSFSGWFLWDVANMLRYAHQMPPAYEDSFLKGLESGGVSMPENWRALTNLLNVLSLLDCLARSDPEKHPLRCADIHFLLNRMVQ